MARRKNQGPLEDLLDIAAGISWKASLLIAFFSYMIFHQFAGIQITLANDISTLPSSVYKLALIYISQVLQFILPLVFITGAVVSIIKGKRRRTLLDQQTSIESIRDLSWQEFELLAAEAFRRKGFVVTENGGGGADGGIDIILLRNGKKSIVQCKRWKTFSIGVQHIRELYGVMTAERANDCIFVSSGNYTAEARLFAEDKPIWLIDGKELLKIINGIQFEPKAIYLSSDEAPLVNSPPCPICASEMVKRKARKGDNAGNEFWGCSRFPKCRGINQI